jgi:hypothetical protein
VPRTPTRKVHVFTIPVEQLEKLPQRALLDMLRYDQAHPAEVFNGCWRLVSPHPPTVARWASFGIAVTDKWTED